MWGRADSGNCCSFCRCASHRMHAVPQAFQYARAYGIGGYTLQAAEGHCRPIRGTYYIVYLPHRSSARAARCCSCASCSSRCRSCSECIRHAAYSDSKTSKHIMARYAVVACAYRHTLSLCVAVYDSTATQQWQLQCSASLQHSTV